MNDIVASEITEALIKLSDTIGELDPEIKKKMMIPITLTVCVMGLIYTCHKYKKNLKLGFNPFNLEISSDQL